MFIKEELFEILLGGDGLNGMYLQFVRDNMLFMKELFF